MPMQSNNPTISTESRNALINLRAQFKQRQLIDKAVLSVSWGYDFSG